MVSSAMARPSMSNTIASKNSHLGGRSDDRASALPLGGIGNGVKGWASDIWGDFKPGSTRDSSRSRDTGTFGIPKDAAESKSAFTSLLPSSDTETWARHRSPWDPAQSCGVHLRSSGVSPARRSSGQMNGGHLHIDTSQTASPYLTSARLTPAVGPRPLHGAYDTSTLGSRLSDGSTTAYSHFQRSSDESSRFQGTASSWADASSIHSPPEDLRSFPNSDFFGASSAGASRHGSMPPSRHSNESSQFLACADNFPRAVASNAGSRGQSLPFSSLSNGRISSDRQNSQHSDVVPAFSRMALENDCDQTLVLRRGTNVMNGNNIHGPQHEDTHLRRSNQDFASYHEDHFASGVAPHPPDGYTGAFHNPDPLNTRFRYAERGAWPVGSNDLRQAQSYSTAEAQAIYDQHYHPREDSPRGWSNVHPVILDRKLRGLQQEQQQHQLLPHASYQTSFMGPYRGQFNPYASSFGLHAPMSMNGINPNAFMSPLSYSMMPLGLYPPMVEPPRGPRQLEAGAIQSSKLLEFRASSKGNRRWELKEIYDDIVEFSGDQHGSRLIQQKLETANSDEKQIIFMELLPNVVQLMQDVFGNYVIQKFFEHGDQNQKKILASKMKGHVVKLSLQMYGCRVVQKALEHVLADQQASLVSELEPSMIRCVKDQNGNHVVQKAIERVPIEHIQFIIDGFKGKVGELATHSYGCRVIQRVLEYCDEPAKRSILFELHNCGSTLISDQYGNYVTQHIIQYGFPEDQAQVIGLVTANLLAFSKHKFASNVVEKCLVHGTTEQRRNIMLAVIQTTDRESTCIQLVKDGYGNYVIQQLLDTLEGKDWLTFVEHLQPELVRAKRTTLGKQIQAVEKKIMEKMNARIDSPTMAGDVRDPLLGLSSATPAKLFSPTPPGTSANSPPIPKINLSRAPPTPDSVRTPRAPPLIATPYSIQL